MTPFPVTNTPLQQPEEAPPPEDPPMLFAHRVEQVISRQGLRIARRFFRRCQRMISLAERGDHRTARAVRPDDVEIDYHRHTLPAYQGVPMDFTAFPFRTLLPTRWPDRPPSCTINIRAIRRDFRSHPTFPNRALRGELSHGNPSRGEMPFTTRLTAPHGSALRRLSVWHAAMEKEVASGWSRPQARQSDSMTSWPIVMCPTSLAERHVGEGKWRLCHDMSWPPEGHSSGLLSPNAYDKLGGIPVVKFARCRDFCDAAQIFCSSGLPVLLSKIDLPSAYKGTAHQRSAMWRRATLSKRGTQTLECTCFGQVDGPFLFSEYTSYETWLGRRELSYADACYPPRDPAVVAWMEARRRAHVGGAEGARQQAPLFFVLALLDDFGLLSISDLVHRPDGSPLLAPDGSHRHRASLHFDVLHSLLTRHGWPLHEHEDKIVRPCRSLVFLGGVVDLDLEQLQLEPAKRVRYSKRLASALARPSIALDALTSLAFKMLVVCEVYPLGRQWLHSVFRRVRASHLPSVDLHFDTDVRDALQQFLDLLRSDLPLAIPLACRLTFPFAHSPSVLVSYMDASGACRAGELHTPGFGAWAVRDRTLYYFYGVWSPRELLFSITVLESLCFVFVELAFPPLFPEVSHLFELTDNSGAEAVAETFTPHAVPLQHIAAKRATILAAARIFTRAGRVTSADNKWADDLSRGYVARVLREATALGLAAHLVTLTPAVRDTTWLPSP